MNRPLPTCASWRGEIELAGREGHRHLRSAAPALSTVTEDETRIGDRWTNTGAVIKRMAYQIEGYMEGGADSVEQQLASQLGGRRLFSVFRKNEPGALAEMFRVRKASFGTGDDPSSFTKFQWPWPRTVTASCPAPCCTRWTRWKAT